ncbi:ammonium transporter [Stappia sp. F7233]|uniref:Ammonium transporter n=1 Tax=Stappia albiluteola TaxID=2758565 RepID=A0A839AI85_9HYPH|nr:ammonium transporter [Stappia albiluteola]MBA5778634.1 ammonium transporter [Stappia albiluteola]
MKKLLTCSALAVGSLFLMVDPGLAQDTTAAAEAAPEFAKAADTAYIFNTLLFLIGGFLVMFMAAGFAMLEAGLVRSKNVSMQCLKNITLYAIASLMFWAFGYNLMYDGVDGGFIGSFLPKSIPAPDADAGDYAAASDFFFQLVFCATTASIVSGTLAERIKLWPFIAFTVVLTGFIYPIAGSWQWGAGWLSVMGFSDFAGSTLVHSVGGWAALAGALVLGARRGKYGPGGQVTPFPGSSMPLATLGTFILWLGWFGFNGASQLAMGTISDASAVSRIFVNTNTAAAAGVVVAVVATQIIYKKVDITMALNGALAGLVSITAEPLQPSIFMSIVIGGIGALIVVFAVPLLDKLKIDDVVGAIPVHLLAGIWGTIAVPLTNAETSFVTQAIGIVSYGVFVFVGSLVLWLILKSTVGIRVSPEEEALGLDKVEIGVEAYPEFGQGSQRV